MKLPVPVHITQLTQTVDTIPIYTLGSDTPDSYEVGGGVSITGEFKTTRLPDDAFRELTSSKQFYLVDHRSMIPAVHVFMKQARENKVEWLTSPDKEKREFAEWLSKEGLL